MLALQRAGDIAFTHRTFVSLPISRRLASSRRRFGYWGLDVVGNAEIFLSLVASVVHPEGYILGREWGDWFGILGMF